MGFVPRCRKVLDRWIVNRQMIDRYKIDRQIEDRQKYRQMDRQIQQSKWPLGVVPRGRKVLDRWMDSKQIDDRQIERRWTEIQIDGQINTIVSFFSNGPWALYLTADSSQTARWIARKIYRQDSYEPRYIQVVEVTVKKQIVKQSSRKVRLDTYILVDMR